MSKTLEQLFKQSDLSAKRPLEVWRHLQPGKAAWRPSAAALARRASGDIEMWQVRH
jgi:hypothetical protein